MDPENKSGERDGRGAGAAADVDPDAAPTAEEIAAAEALRDALADPREPHEDATLLRAIAQAHAPRPLDPAEHAALVARALGRTPPVARPRVRPLSARRGWPVAAVA